MILSSTSLKKLSLALSVAGIGALIGLPALAQSSSSSSTAPEFKLSKEGFIILCARTPMNSRCEGSPYYTGSSSTSPTENPAASPSGTTAPTQNLPSESPVPSPQGQAPGGMMRDGMSPGMMHNGSSSGSNGTMAPMGGTPAPVQNLPNSGPQDGGTPSLTPGGTMTPMGGTAAPVQNLPNSGPRDGGTPSSGSGTMNSPSGTTAPTQNLPSESPNK